MPKKPLSKKALEFKTEKTLSSSEMKNVDTEKETSVHGKKSFIELQTKAFTMNKLNDIKDDYCSL